MCFSNWDIWLTTQYGGDVAIVGIDSITGEGMDELKNTLYEESLIRELRADRKVRLLIWLIDEYRLWVKVLF